MNNLTKYIKPFHIVLAGLLLYSVAAYFSRGYYHPDEHYQILEFAGHKLGFFPKDALAWEFNARIRPSLQPFLAMGVIQVCRAAGITEAFDWAMILRFISGALTLWVFHALSRPLSTAFLHPATTRLLLLGAAVFCWFMPFLSVRFSSENWSALALLAGLYFLLETEENPDAARYRRLGMPLLVGILFGLSFWFRFQTAFSILGIGLWVLFIRRPKLPVPGLLSVFAGGLVAFVSGVVLDRLFYGEWLLTPYNYYKVNILQDKAASFGVEPWWWYLPISIRELVWPIGLVLFALFLFGTHCARRHVVVWAILPFVISHSVVEHKELRFMFPLIFPFLFLAVLGFERCAEALRNLSIARVFWNLNWAGLFAVNAWFLYSVNTRPATEGFPYFHFLAERARDRDVRLYSEPPGPYPPFRRGLMRACFYRSPRVKVTVLSDWQYLTYGDRYPLEKGVLILTTKPEALFKYTGQVSLKKVFVYKQPQSPGSTTIPPDWVFYEVE